MSENHKSLQYRKVWGRRQSRPLKTTQKEAMEKLFPQLLIPLGLKESELIPPSTLYPERKSAYALEIGFGGGEHLLTQAKHHPDWGYIGCEPFINGVANLVTDIQAEKIQNIRIVKDDARLLLSRLPNQSITQVFILFADPWPKKRHHKRRIIQSETIANIARILIPDGILHIATDDPGYLEWILNVMANAPDFKLDLQGRRDIFEHPNDWPKTRYEEKALRQGRLPGYMRYLKIS
jgi:tRNA (guanine-N7-)-methyltransferase